jgi:surface polysaccharide O-acyltransferase-like enzyme
MERLESPGTAERYAAPDVLKLISCVGVIFIHTASLGFNTYIVHCFNWVSSAFWSSLFRFCVPVFLMCTGALLLDPRREISVRRTLTHYFLRMLLIYLFWMLAYEYYFVLSKLLLYGEYTPGDALRPLVEVLTFQNSPLHLYYLQILLILYLFLPAARVFVQNASRSVYRYILILWFILGIVLPYLWQFEPMASNTGIPAQYPISATYSAIGYALLGWYLRTAEIRRAHALRFAGLFLLGFAVTFGGTVIGSFALDAPYDALMEGMTPGAAIMSVGLYGFVAALTEGRGPMPRAARMAKATFCIYLIHFFFVLAFRGLNINVYLFYCLFSIPVLSAATLALSVLGYLILSRIPFVKDHLI